MKQTVYSYFERDPNLTGFDQVIEIWKDWWSKAGYEPVILTEADAREHPRFDEIEAHINTIPTVNPALYERACWLRWLAFEAKGGGLMVDLDVLPNPRFFGLRIGEDKPYIVGEEHGINMLERNSVPCAVWSTGGDLTLEIIKAYTVDDCQEVRGMKHGSDMFAFKKAYPLRKNYEEGVCIEFGSTNWKTAQLVHFSSESIGPRGFSKATFKDAVELLRPVCYIAGPMTGKPFYNFPAFLDAEEVMKNRNWAVKNPAKHDLMCGFDPSKDIPTKEQLDEFMKWDVEQVMTVDAVVAIPGWEKSTGAIAEVALAQWRHIPTYTLCEKGIIECQRVASMWDNKSILDEVEELLS